MEDCNGAAEGINVMAGNIFLPPCSLSIKLLEKFDFELWGKLVDVAEIDGEVCSQCIYGRQYSSKQK
ncbi:hypothetical protein ACXR6G_00460 [Ancylomarina sp. YFZ004]